MAVHSNWEGNGLCRIYTEQTSGDEVIISNQVIQSDPRFPGIKYVINDFSGINSFIVGKSDIKNIAIGDDVISAINPTLKIAIVATFEPLLEWVHLYIEMMKDASYQCRLFTNSDDAYQWVNESVL